ncbi:MAG: ABC transporter ATP-binding protein [Desulfobulbaceae bacterium]|nr:ABC transporter ATP-binding protein [Desulfobulbaceae bacterium]
MSESFLKIDHISKIFHPGKDVEVTGLHDINLTFARGEFVVVSGPSGSGKTTLLNIIGGLDEASDGEVRLEGQRLTGLPEKELSLVRRDHIGFIFQSYNLLPVLTARENIEYIMNLRGWRQKERRLRTDEIAGKLEIKTLLDKLPNQMSGGQQQRVAVARAVATKPKLILADEPTANLDSKSAEKLMDMMQRLNEEEKITIIFSSHDPLVINKAKHSIKLRDGKVVSNEYSG